MAVGELTIFCSLRNINPTLRPGNQPPVAVFKKLFDDPEHS